MRHSSEKNFNNDKELDFIEFFYALSNKKFFIISITTTFAITSIVFALLLPNIYTSRAILMPEDSEGEMGGMLAQYSGMANLAGISLPSEPRSLSGEAIERIKSFDFFVNHFLPSIALENLIALKEWDATSNKLIYKDIFDQDLNVWKRKSFFTTKIGAPSAQEAYKVFKEKMSISEDKKTSLVTLSIDHLSPILAKKWVEIILYEIDRSMRENDKMQATNSINYINNLSSNTNYEEIKKTLSSLQQDQIKKLMMIEANKNYIFKVIDSPVVPELKSQPKRSIIVILGTILGFIFSVLYSLFSYFIKNPIKL